MAYVLYFQVFWNRMIALSEKQTEVISTASFMFTYIQIWYKFDSIAC